MDRRNFLRSLLGSASALTVTATMAEAGALAEFLEWCRRKPVSVQVPGDPFDEINSVTLETIKGGLAKNFQNDTPFYMYLFMNSKTGKVSESKIVYPYKDIPYHA
jgi:hypothetical protein